MECQKDLIAKACNLALYSSMKDLLLWKRCIYMTFDQYKKGEHLNNKIYTHSAITNDVKRYVITHLQELAMKLHWKKVPLPVYVLVAKKLEYDSSSSVLPATCKTAYTDLISGKLNYDKLKKAHENKQKIYRQYEQVFDEKTNKYVDNPSKYTDYDISCFVDKDNKIIDRGSSDIQNNIFVYDRLGDKQNMDALKASSLASYKFMGNYEVIIYVPNLTNDLRYFTSFFEFSSQNKWMDMISNPNIKFLSIIPFKKDYKENIVNMIGEEKYSQNPVFSNMVANLNANDEREYPFIKDMAYICFNMGCTTEYGEDLGEIVPTVATTYGDQLSNAAAKGPYFPTKCLKTHYYHKHMMDLTSQQRQDEYQKGLREQLAKDISSFKNNYEAMQRGETPSQEYSSDNIIDVIKGSAARFRNKTYTEGDKEDQYSKEYNRKILSELAFRKNSFPGVQEIVFPVFRINEGYTELTQYMHYMPWGNILLKQEYVLSEGDVLKIEEVSLKSFDKVYEMKYDAEHKLSLFANGSKVRTIVDADMKEYSKKTLAFESGSLNLYGYDKDGNNDNRYSIFVSKADTISPLSIIIEGGYVNVYQNGFTKIGSI